MCTISKYKVFKNYINKNYVYPKVVVYKMALIVLRDNDDYVLLIFKCYNNSWYVDFHIHVL